MQTHPKRMTPGIVIFTAVLNFLWAAVSFLLLIWVVGLRVMVAKVSRSQEEWPASWQLPEGVPEQEMVLTFVGFAAGFLIVLLVMMMAAALWTGMGLLKAKRAAWYTQIAFSMIGLFVFPLGTLLNVIILVFFFQPGVREHFSVS